MSIETASIVITPNAYKASKLYALKPTDGSGDLTVVRATTATRVNSSGVIEEVLANVPRLDYTGGGCPSILVEPQRTNLALRSEEFDNASFWTLSNSGSISVNTDVAPDGTTTADRLIAGANFSQLQGSIVGTIDTAYTGSIYIKRINGSGVVNLRVAENADIPITVTNEWTRVSATVTSTTTTIRIGVKLATSGDEVAIWGAQLEQGAYATSYIPTVTEAVTRVKDVISRTDLYTNGLVTNSGGTWFVELINNKDLIRDAPSNMFLGTSTNGNDTAITIRSNSTTSAKLSIGARISGTITSSRLIATETAKVLVKWNGVTCDFFINGTKYNAGTSFPFIELNFLTIDGVDVPKYIKQMQFFPTPLTDLECETLTTL